MAGNQLSFLFFFSLLVAGAQNRVTLSGYIKDKSSGEELMGAILVPEKPGVGAVANPYGYYSLSLPAGRYTFVTRLTGYKEQTQMLLLEKNTRLDWLMEEKEHQLNEVEIVGKKNELVLATAGMGVEKLERRETNRVPTLFGERDVLKIIQLYPGVKSAGEGNGNFHVRGGGADQNLVLLDEAPVYNASHLLGFFSTFNSDVVRDATLIKGNSPARYGGRLSSVLDVHMREGNNQKLRTSGGLGLITSRLAVEGPIQKNKSSFLVAGRRSYADLFLKLSPKYADYILYFYDVNAKANYQLDENNRLFFSGYFGKDRMGLSSDFGVFWGNRTGTIRWNRTFNARWFSNTSLIYSNFYSASRMEGLGTEFNFNSQIRDLNLKQEFQYDPDSRNSWRFGLNSIHHSFMPARFETGQAQKRASRYGLENAVFAGNTWKADSMLTLEYGLRLSAYSVVGKGEYHRYTLGKMEDTLVQSPGQIGKTYLNPEPRFSVGYRLNALTTIKGAYSRNTQNVHLLTNSTSSYPTDQWIGTSYQVKPELCDQFSLGYFRHLMENRFELSIESYYKYLQNQMDYKNGADLKGAADVESELLFGVGRAYGLEFCLKKKIGRVTGWVSYTLSKTERSIADIEVANWYLARQDRTHELAVVSMYQLTDRWTLSGNFVFYTGNAVTFPRGRYELDGTNYLYYPHRNGDRMPAYHRMDVSLEYEGPKNRKFESSWNFSLYNLYGRQNAYVIGLTTRENTTNPDQRWVATKTSLFRWVPGITYNFSY